jgi:polysaccharide export outer membrane protein
MQAASFWRGWSTVGLALWLVLAGSVSVADAAETRAAYTLRHGDVVNISVWREDMLRGEVRVLPDGSITFPLAGRVEVAGLTTVQAQERIATRLNTYIPDAVVSVVVTGIDGSRVHVIGRVQRPGPVLLSSPNTTVLQVLSEAGGLDRFADGNAIRVLRDTPQGPEVLPVRYNDLMRGTELGSNIRLQPGDTILVP